MNLNPTTTIWTQFTTASNQIRELYHNNQDAEQSAIRIIFSLLFIIYLFSMESYDNPLWITAYSMIKGMLFFSVLLFIANLFHVFPTVYRRITAIIADIGFISLAFYLLGELSAPWWPLYLWVILGNGFRFGNRYLFASALLSIICFTSVVLYNNFWLAHMELAIGLIVSLFVIPGYVSILINRLYEARKKSEEANLAKSEFLARMSHEIRTPLNGIVGIAQLLRNSELKGKEKEYIDGICASSQTLLQLIKDVLDISKIEAGKLQLEDTRFDLYTLINSTIRMLKPEAERRNIKLGCKISLDIPFRLVGDPLHIRQVLFNLVANALKFTEKGKVELICSRVKSDNSTSTIKFEVVDTGIGIPEDIQPYIFDQFSQANGSTTRRFGGTGLGTAIAKQLVELMNGSIGLQSTPGVGSKFWFDIRFKHQKEDAVNKDIKAMHDVKVLRLCNDLNETTATIQRLTDWGVKCKNITDGKQCKNELIKSIERDCVYEVIIFDNHIDVDLISDIANMVDSNGLFGIVKLLVIHNKKQCADIEEKEKQQLCFQNILETIYSIEKKHICLQSIIEPINKELLFNALHASHSSSLVDDSIINTEDSISIPSVTATPLKIIVAEDNEINRLVIGRMLQIAGHQIHLVGNGFQLIDALEEASYDLVILDMHMPKLGGLEAFKTYGCAHPDSDLPFIMLTANATIEARIEAKKAGIEWFLTKPVACKELLSTINNAIVSTNDDINEIKSEENTYSGCDAELVDKAAIIELAALASGDTFFEKLLQKFEQDADKLIHSIEDALKKKDCDQLRSSIHALKGSSTNLGLDKLTERILLIESQDDAILIKYGSETVGELKYIYEESKKALSDLINESFS